MVTTKGGALVWTSCEGGGVHPDARITEFPLPGTPLMFPILLIVAPMRKAREARDGLLAASTLEFGDEAFVGGARKEFGCTHHVPAGERCAGQGLDSERRPLPGRKDGLEVDDDGVAIEKFAYRDTVLHRSTLGHGAGEVTDDLLPAHNRAERRGRHVLPKSAARPRTFNP